MTVTAFELTNGAAARGAGSYGDAPLGAVIRRDERNNRRIHNLVASVAS